MTAEEYALTQFFSALINLGNREEVRKSHQCSDQELKQHPDWLLLNFLTSGRIKDFIARYREHLVIEA